MFLFVCVFQICSVCISEATDVPCVWGGVGVYNMVVLCVQFRFSVYALYELYMF